jgi:hypothetical protein
MHLVVLYHAKRLSLLSAMCPMTIASRYLIIFPKSCKGTSIAPHELVKLAIIQGIILSWGLGSGSWSWGWSWS